ncbi:MAG: acyl-CoA/acyl-ACP dehydrogenase [Planctomycetes bacterium]|nr:acyl-CoA/acyl-ACP dehydrogenase [Planctomycetota bacterium]
MLTTPFDSALDDLCSALATGAERADQFWPAESLRRCAEQGVLRWFLPEEQGGLGWSEADLLRGYLKLSAACLTTTFILTQATGALKRLASAGNPELCDVWLPLLLTGEKFCTLGISHLTTSRRHLGTPALTARRAEPDDPQSDFVLDGYSAWVTGAPQADLMVIGAQLEDGMQMLLALPTDLPGVTTEPPARLVGLSGSDTGPVRLSGVRVSNAHVLAAPQPNVMQGATGAKTGGLQTSALAIGLSGAAIDLLETEAKRRGELGNAAEGLRGEQQQLVSNLLALAEGLEPCGADELRASANSLALRSTQAALAAAKGAGYAAGHPAGRWCRQALFFLVWSCPAPVMAANLCELAGIGE